MIIDFRQLSIAMIADVRSLKTTKFRKEHQLFIAEGKKICNELLKSDYEVRFIIVNKDNINDLDMQSLINDFNQKQINIYVTSNSKFVNLCDADTPQGILAVVKMKFPPITSTTNTSNSNISLTSNASFVALDNISDPGNVGTIIRTAEWFGIEQILLIGDCANQYNPKVVRSSMGSIFRTKIINLDNSTDILNNTFKNFDNSNNFNIFAASLDATKILQDIKPTKPFGLIVGNESRGISTFLNEIITQKFLIAGNGNAESLNVGIAAGIALYHLCGN